MSWLVHFYTASGLVMAFVAATNVTESNYRGAFMWIAVALVVDATDGFLARRVGVAETLPWFDGALLDNLVDFTTYVFVPALFIWQALIVPPAWSMPVCALILLSSAYGFSRKDAKTSDDLFTGFPSYWNVVAFYLFVARWTPQVNAALLILFALLVFIPVRYVYPSRTPHLRGVTVSLAIAWGVAMLWLLVQSPTVSRPLFWASLAFPVYYAVLSVVLSIRRARA